MSRLTISISALCMFLLMTAASVSAAGEPSSGARGMPGAKGTFEFKPGDWMEGVTTWWKDSDGVDPGAPGCHIGTDSEGNPNGRLFGEACLPDGLLVESNPAAGEVHQHGNDIGHPDTFDCNEWSFGMCQTSYPTL